MPVTKALSHEHNERARALVRQLRAERFNGSQLELAAALGVAQPTLSGFLAGKRGAGGKIMAGLMKLAPDEAIQISGGIMVDTFSMARFAMERLVGVGIPRGEAWDLLAAVADSVEEPSMLNYFTEAVRLSRTRPRLPTPPPPVTEYAEPGPAEKRLLGSGGSVRDEIPAKGEPQRSPNVRRRAVPKGHKR